MISLQQARKYCCEDISNIENYEQAVSDTTSFWDVHHRAEILPCGRFSIRDLKKFGLYWQRPACELIFMPASEHRHIHHSGKTCPRGENSYRYGKHLSAESRAIISAKAKARLSDPANNPMYGSHRTGADNPFFGHHHTEKSKKLLSESKSGARHPFFGMHWYTDGIKSVRAKECPFGFVPGRLIKH